MRWMDAIVRISRAGSGQVGQEPSHSTQHHSLGQRIPSSFDKVTQPLSLNMDGAVTNWTRGIKVLSFQLTAVISFKQEDSQDSTPLSVASGLARLALFGESQGFCSNLINQTLRPGSSPRLSETHPEPADGHAV